MLLFSIRMEGVCSATTLQAMQARPARIVGQRSAIMLLRFCEVALAWIASLPSMPRLTESRRVSGRTFDRPWGEENDISCNNYDVNWACHSSKANQLDIELELGVWGDVRGCALLAIASLGGDDNAALATLLHAFNTNVPAADKAGSTRQRRTLAQAYARLNLTRTTASKTCVIALL